MKNLIAINPNDFPLPASLFYRMKNGQPGSTWNYLARDGVGEVSQLQNKQIEYGSKAMTFMVFNMSDPQQNVVNPFIGSPTAAQVVAGQNAPDMDELNRWQPLLAPGQDPGVYFIPCLFCGDDRATTNNTAFHELFLPAAITWLNKYSKAYLIASEADKSMSVQQMADMIAYIKRFADGRPVGVHLQWNRQSPLPFNADWLAYEFTWNPWKGEEHSLEETVREASDVIFRSPIPVFFSEMDIHCEGSLAREKSRALQKLSGCYGLPGPT
jgi:hypothetical protein